jgi:1-acyl-sn-glycerol-3-phosphate acyltransferase
MIAVLAGIYGVLAFALAMLLAFVVGTVLALPFALVPRGRRERYTAPVAQVYARLVVYVLLLVRVRLTGRVKLAPRQGALFICNHRSWLDAMLLPAHTRTNGLSKREVLWMPFLGFYAWLAGTVFFDRSSHQARLRARQQCIAQLRCGNRMFVFPEGTRSRSGELAERVHLRLVQDCYEQGIVVVPCAVYGTERVLPVGHFQAYPLQRAWLDIGDPVPIADHPDGLTYARAAWQEVVKRVERLRREAEARAEVAPDQT